MIGPFGLPFVIVTKAGTTILNITFIKLYTAGHWKGVQLKKLNPGFLRLKSKKPKNLHFLGF